MENDREDINKCSNAIRDAIGKLIKLAPHKRYELEILPHRYLLSWENRHLKILYGKREIPLSHMPIEIRIELVKSLPEFIRFIESQATNIEEDEMENDPIWKRLNR